LSEAINRAIANKVPICGTSAGEAVLGGAFFSAKHGTVFSDSVLLNPEHLSVDIDWNFFQIPHLEDVIFDSHYTERERHGRLLGFMSKSKTRGIGIDESTALCVDRRGRAVVFGEGHVYFVNSVGLNCFAVYIMNKSGWFSIRDWSGRGGQQFDWKVCDGILDSGDKHNK
jgi:beta-aspartyl-peptidase (threonine type)